MGFVLLSNLLEGEREREGVGREGGRERVIHGVDVSELQHYL